MLYFVKCQHSTMEMLVIETFKIKVRGKEILVKENETILNASILQAGEHFYWL